MKLAMATVLLYLFLLSLPSFIFSQEIAQVGESTSLHILPSVNLRNSPGSKPGMNVHAGRVYIQGLSRMNNLKLFSHAVKVKVAHLNSSIHQSKFEICFHRNTSLEVGMCPSYQWQKVSKGSWDQRMSPFDHKLLDIRMASSSLEPLELTLQNDYSTYRVVFLILGTLLIAMATTLSESLIFYYSSAMAVGIILVVLIVLFQGMRLLPTGRGCSLGFLVYSSLIGLGSFLLSYLPRLLHILLAELGISEEMYNPLAVFFLVFITLVGAWLGFWVVRKLVLTEEGSIDTTISQFVAWSIRILGAVMILQCSLDPLLAAEALVFAIFLSPILRKVMRPRFLRRVYRKIRKTSASSPQKSKYHGASSPNVDFQYSRATTYTQVTGLSKRTLSQPKVSDTFYSSYHKTPQRRNLSKEEWRTITKECTKNGLAELVSSPEFGQWAKAHAERLTLAPIKQETRGWFSWFR